MRTNLRSVQLCIFKARLTKIEMLTDIYKTRSNTKTRENWQETHKKTYSFSKFTCFFLEYGRRKALIGIKRFKPGVLALTNSVASDNDRFMFRSDQKHIKMNVLI